MKKVLMVLTALCLVLSSFVFIANAEEPEVYEAYEGWPFLKGEIYFLSTEKFDIEEYEGETPIDFLGIPIVKLEYHTFKEYYSYSIKCSPEADTVEAYEFLKEHEAVTEISLNTLSIPEDDYARKYPTKSPYIGLEKEELLAITECYSSEITIYAKSELSLTENESKGKKYLYGVEVASLEPVEEEEGFVYKAVLTGKRNHIDNKFWADIINRHSNVIEVKTTSDYGSGDIDKNGVIDEFDYLLVARMHLETYLATHEELGYADVNLDSIVDEYDYILLARHYFGTYVIE